MINHKDIISITIGKKDLHKLDTAKDHLDDVLYYAEILDSKGYEYDIEYNHLKRVSMIIKNNNSIAGFITIGEGTDWIKNIKLIDESLIDKFNPIDLWVDYGIIYITGELPVLSELTA